MLIPLSRVESQGCYLAIQFQDGFDGTDWMGSIADIDRERLFSTYTGAEQDWRCGLIDENGNEIVAVRYTSVQLTDDNALIFSSPGGNSMTYALPK